MVARGTNVEKRCCRLNRRICHDNHDVGIGSEFVDKSRKVAIPNLHGLKLRAAFGTTQLELLDNVGYLFESVHISLLHNGRVANHKESGFFKENHLVGFTNEAKIVQMLFQNSHIGNQRVNHGGPSLVKSLIPNASGEAGNLERKRKL